MRGRKPTRQTGIASRLRMQIVRGDWAAGQQVPSQIELAKRFGAPPLTIRRAIARLVHEGFLQTSHRRGTFVCQRPPHEHHYALVVPSDPADTSTLWSRLYATLVNEAPGVAQASHREIIPFYGLDNGPRAADYARLAQWCEEGSVAGIIFASNPFHLIGTPIFEKPGIPRVALQYPQQFPHVPVVSVHNEFASKVFAWFAERGRRRLAVLMQWDELRKQNLAQQAKEHGLELRPEWQLPMTPHLVEAGAAYARLLFSATESNRPDALLVSDDNYVESVLNGLRAAGVRLGSDLDVVTHCNFPWAGAMPTQVKKIGYSTHEVLKTCLRLLDCQRRGSSVPPVTIIEAKFEEEIKPMTGRDREAHPVRTEGVTP